MTDFLLDQSERPFQWGVCDCCLFVADWIAWRDKIDPAAHLRGTYSTEREMRRLLQAAGGIVAVVEDCAGRAQLVERKSAPDVGDVGLVQVAIRIWRGRAVSVPVGAICLGQGRWSIKTRERGLMVQPFPLLRAWGRHG